MGISSRRPISISSDKTSLLAWERMEKFSSGPSMPRPGPTLLMHVSDAVNDSVKPRLSQLTTSVPASQTRMKLTKNTLAEEMTRSSTGRPSDLMTLMWFGWIRRFISRCRLLASSVMREILMPPEVDPAHAPVNISAVSTT